MTDLPISWCEIDFDEGFESISPNTNKLKQKDYQKFGEIPVIDQGESFISGFTDDTDALVTLTSPLIGFGDHTRRFKFITHSFAIGADGLKLIKPTESLWNPKFAYYQLLNTKIEDRGYSRHFQYLRKSKFSLAPTNEQIHIVEKIEELFSELDSGIEELETAQTKLELYRQSLLKSAVEGELSKEWRETQAEISETGEQLLERILIERRERWEQEKLKEFAEKGKKPPKNWQEKYPEPAQPEIENLPQLPEGWVWVKLGQLTTIGTGVTPLKSKADYYINGEIPWVTSGALNDEFVQEASHYITELAVKECRLKLYPIGTLLVAMYGEGKTRGKSSELTIPATINQAIAALVFDDSTLKVKDYIKYYLLSSYEDMRRQAAGGVQPNLNLQIIANLDIPLPPLSEQSFINTKLESIIELVENQSTGLTSSLSLLNSQKKNILTQAFQGKLVAQDSNDEPAQTLLERVQQQREAEALAKKASPKKRVTKKSKKEVSMSNSILDILKQRSDWISGQDLATAFGLNGNSKIVEIEQFYEQLRALSLNDKILVKPDQQHNKEQDLIKLKDNSDAS